MGKRNPRILVWQIQCKHDVVKESYEELSWRKCKKRDVAAGRWDVAWSDTPAVLYREISTAAVHSHQRLNHFPLMQYLCRKDLLACNLRELRRSLGSAGGADDFQFVPETWIFPSEEQSFWQSVGQHFEAEENALGPQEKKARAKRLKRKARRDRRRQRKQSSQRKGSRISNASTADESSSSSSEEEDELQPFTCIAKPQDGSQGKGISIFQLHSDYKGLSSESETRQQLEQLKQSRVVIQRFIDKPLLVDDFKWDMRVYVLVTNLEPLTAYLYDDGLARFCTTEYEAPDADNLDDIEMHLTNFSINWESDAFIDTDSDGTGSKRSLDSVLTSLGGPEAAAAVWRDIGRVTAQTLLAFAPKLRSAYRSHFGHLRLASKELCPAVAEGPDMESSGGSFGSKRPDGQSSSVPSVCFEVLGFDFILDAERRLYLLEVNSAPSLATETLLDERVKSQVLQESFALLGLNPAIQREIVRRSRESLKARNDDHLRRREAQIQRKAEIAAGIAFNSTLPRNGDGHLAPPKAKVSSAGSHKGEQQRVAAAAGIPLKAVRASQSIRSSTKPKSRQDAEAEDVTDEKDNADDDEEEDEEDDESEESESEDESTYDCEAFQPGEAKAMDGVGPYVTHHFVKLLPNGNVPGHNAILAAAERLLDR